MTGATLAPRGLAELVGTTDHKRVGALGLATAFAFFLAGGALAALMRTELAQPGLQVVSTDTYNALFTMHGSTMIYLVISPAALALGVYLVPLQLGSSRIAGPRWALAGWWLYVLGGLTMYAGFLTRNGAADATWIGVDPLADAVNSPGEGMDLWIFGVSLAAAGQFLWGVCLLATLAGRRAPGMTLLRMPVFAWAMLATALMVAFAYPVLLVAMGALWAERQWGGVLSPPDGPIVYQHLFWFFGHPVVYVMFFPFVGTAAEILAVFSGRRFFGYRPLVLSLLAFSALSMSVWAHHMFTTDAVANRYFSLTSTALLVPAGVEYFDSVATLWGAQVRLRVPLLFALAFLVQFLIGGLSGIWVASPPLDYHANNSYVVVAHFHYTLAAGSFFGLLAALWFWWPKLTGCLLREGLGRVQFWLAVIGANLAFLPLFFAGEDGMTRRIADYPAGEDWELPNLLSTIGAYVFGLSVLVFLMNVVWSLTFRRAAGDDPWEGHTLEWATSSPPPRANFTEPLPPIRSYAPLLDARAVR